MSAPGAKPDLDTQAHECYSGRQIRVLEQFSSSTFQMLHRTIARV